MGYNKLIHEYYINLSNLASLLKTLTDSYRLLIGGAFELNNIPEARTKYVKEAVNRADKLGDEIDHLIDLLEECGESYYKYVAVMNDYILKNGNTDLILTEVDSDLQFSNIDIDSDSNPVPITTVFRLSQLSKAPLSP